jgi:hypothetical protein
MLSANRRGSRQSTASGKTFTTSQKRQFLVHFSPRIMKLAVPALQHSPLFGQLPEVQIVFRSCSSMVCFTFEYFSPWGNGDFNQSGSLLSFCLFCSSIGLLRFPKYKKTQFLFRLIQNKLLKYISLYLSTEKGRIGMKK